MRSDETGSDGQLLGRGVDAEMPGHGQEAGAATGIRDALADVGDAQKSGGSVPPFAEKGAGAGP